MERKLICPGCKMNVKVIAKVWGTGQLHYTNYGQEIIVGVSLNVDDSKDYSCSFCGHQDNSTKFITED